MRHLIVDHPIFQDRRRGLHDCLRRRRLSPLRWEVTGIWFMTRHEAGFYRGPTCHCAREPLPAVFVELAESMFDVYRADAFVGGVTKGWGE